MKIKTELETHCYQKGIVLRLKYARYIFKSSSATHLYRHTVFHVFAKRYMMWDVSLCEYTYSRLTINNANAKHTVKIARFFFSPSSLLSFFPCQELVDVISITSLFSPLLLSVLLFHFDFSAVCRRLMYEHVYNTQ